RPLLPVLMALLCGIVDSQPNTKVFIHEQRPSTGRACISLSCSSLFNLLEEQLHPLPALGENLRNAGRQPQFFEAPHHTLMKVFPLPIEKRIVTISDRRDGMVNVT